MCYAEPQDLTDIVREAIKERQQIKEPGSKATEEETGSADGGGNSGAGVEGGSDPAEKKERSSN